MNRAGPVTDQNRLSNVVIQSPPTLQVVCWGARGSVPSPGPATASIGGNTSCLEVRSADGRRYIFDGGTGIRPLGQQLMAGGPVAVDLFLTHFHWDHIQGLPFFAPLYEAGAFLRIHGAQQGHIAVEDLFAGQMSEAYFPVPFSALRARIEFVHLDDARWADGGTEVEAIRVHHPGNTYGYRLRSGGASVAYIPDNEIALASAEEYARLVRFADGVDVLFHDAMYTTEEYSERRGWGHSTFDQAVELAEDAGVRRLCLFHHAPDRSDRELRKILDRLRHDLARRGSALEVSVAAEGDQLSL